jgi:hypothetical protein
MKCMETAGFLIPRPCSNSATSACGACGKMVCDEHLVPAEGALLCASCAATRGVGPAANRNELQSYYGYDDSSYRWRGAGGTHFTQRDYAAFQEPADIDDTDLTESLDGS